MPSKQTLDGGSVQPPQQPLSDKETFSSIVKFLEMGKELDHDYGALTQSLKPNKNLSLLFIHEPKVSPGDFCQALSDYFFFACLIIDQMLKQNQISANLGATFMQTFYKYKSVISAFTDKYGDKQNLAACGHTFSADFTFLGAGFMGDKARFEAELMRFNPNAIATLRIS